jgi:hypothetical protein
MRLVQFFLWLGRRGAAAWSNWRWDRQIARDARSGRLDRLVRASEMEIRQGRARGL